MKSLSGSLYHVSLVYTPYISLQTISSYLLPQYTRLLQSSVVKQRHSQEYAGQ